MTTSTTQGGTDQDATPVAPRQDRSRPRPPHHGTFEQPLGGTLEPAARSVDHRLHSPWRSPAAVAVGTYLGVTVLLVLVGWLLVHSPVGDPVRGWDRTISEDLSVGRTSGWSDYSHIGTSSADTLPVIGGIVLVSVVLAVLRRWRDLLLLPLAMGLELSVFLTVNYIVARDRPEVAQLGTQPGTHSFPSGHVAATFVLYGGIALLLGIGRWKRPYQLLGWLVVAVPVLSVAFSRVYRGMHFTTDVVAGLVLGVLVLAASAIATRASFLGSRPSSPQEVGA